MSELLRDALSDRELSVLSSIVQVGEDTCRDLLEDQQPMFSHPYFADTRARIRTKLVQIQCEIESRDSKFPFAFAELAFPFNQHIPMLYTQKLVLHIARSQAPGILPFAAKYKTALSYNNSLLCREQIIDFDNSPPIGLVPFYGLLVFGGRDPSFATIQFPEPGFKGIADYINIPKVTIEAKSEAAETFERKKSALKKEFLARDLEEAIL